MNNLLKIVIKDQFRLLAFRKFRPNLMQYSNLYLIFGMFTAWIAGMGRYWDNPRAELWQYLGFGSIIYCFFLAAIIFLILLPLKPKNWAYKNILIFVSFTSLPAFLYAIPVEKFTPLETAQMLNVSFLAIVALWRVILFVLYLKRSAGLTGLQIFVGTFLPIVLIINILTFLNLEHVVFRIMAGLTESEKSGNDLVYQVLIVITILSYALLPVLVAMYAWFIYKIKKSN